MGAIKLATSPTTDEEYGGIIEDKYSTTEQVVGTWIDGKPIYRKTVDCGALPNNSNTTTSHLITNIERVVKIECIAERTSDKVALVLPFVNTSQVVAFVSTTTSDVVIVTNSNLSSYDKTYTTMYYTKTTD